MWQLAELHGAALNRNKGLTGCSQRDYDFQLPKVKNWTSKPEALQFRAVKINGVSPVFTPMPTGLLRVAWPQHDHESCENLSLSFSLREGGHKDLITTFVFRQAFWNYACQLIFNTLE